MKNPEGWIVVWAGYDLSMVQTPCVSLFKGQRPSEAVKPL